MRWDDIRYFLAVARAGGLTPAARLLQVNHSTVFRRVEALEEELSVRLFDRLPTGYALTAAGERMMANALRAEHAVHDLERGVTGMDLREEGLVRITCPGGVAVDPLPRYLRSLRDRHPGVTVQVVTGNRFLSLRRREADIALRPGPRADEELVGRKVATLAWAPHASDDYLARWGTLNSVADLARHDLIGLDESLSSVGVARWLAGLGLDLRFVARSNNVMAMAEMCANGIGVGLLPCLSYPGGRLRRLLPADPATRGDLYLYTHADLQHTARIRAVIDHLVACFAADRALFLGDEPSAL